MMSSPTVPTYENMMLPLLIVAEKGPLTRPEAAEKVADLMGLSPEQRAMTIPSGDATMVRSRVGWARTYLIQAELLKATKRGVFEITDLGRKVLAEKPPAIDAKYLRKFPPFLDFLARSRKPSEGAVAPAAGEPAAGESQETPYDRIEAALGELNGALREDLLQRILEASPAFFERLVIQLLVKMGYGGSREEAAKHLGGSGDNGVDGVIKLDLLGLDRVYIQAKRYALHQKIGRPAIQSFAGALDTFGTTRGVFVTTSSFTGEATECARAILTKQIALIDGDQLADLLIKHDVGVREKQRVLIKDVDEDFFED